MRNDTKVNLNSILLGLIFLKLRFLDIFFFRIYILESFLKNNSKITKLKYLSLRKDENEKYL